MLELAAFWFFATILLLSAVMVIGARNPVHSVLFLILAFFNAARTSRRRTPAPRPWRWTWSM